VVALDMSTPFTAARARNEGFARALATWPDLQFVQFVDGDCELAPGWIDTALATFEAHPDAAVVCGRRREKHPERSIYNALCDVEWDTPTGVARACGGDALMRVGPLRAAGGYNPAVIAGEEPELCIRLRRAGGTIWRIDAEMTAHDANILTLSQWWSRAKRCGYAYALGASMHGAPPERPWVAETRRALTWALALPLVICGAGLAFGSAGAWLLLVYPLQALRLARRSPLPGLMLRIQDGMLSVLGKWAETQGILKYLGDRFAGRQAKIIEYK